MPGEAHSLEWQSPAVQKADYDHHLRCLSPGLGSSLQWHKDRGSMGPTRVGDAHKLPRATGCNPGSEDIPEGSVLLQLDNQTAAAYINNMGGTVSSQLTDLAKALWMWALAKDIILAAEYIPGVSGGGSS